jgi:hypothetical protein
MLGLQGMCGNFGGENVLVTRWGEQTTDAAEFAASWKTNNDCGSWPPIMDYCERDEGRLPLAQQLCEPLKNIVAFGKE